MEKYSIVTAIFGRKIPKNRKNRFYFLNPSSIHVFFLFCPYPFFQLSFFANYALFAQSSQTPVVFFLLHPASTPLLWAKKIAMENSAKTKIAQIFIFILWKLKINCFFPKICSWFYFYFLFELNIWIIYIYMMLNLNIYIIKIRVAFSKPPENWPKIWHLQ